MSEHELERTHSDFNRYDREHFPESWGEGEFDFLADFLREEYGDELVRVLGGDYDYALFRRVDDE